MKAFPIVIGVLLACGLLGAAGTVRPARAAANGFRQGIAYGPFRSGQSPETGIYPSLAQVRADMSLLRPVADSLRTYGCRNLEVVVTAAGESGLPVALGAWLSGDAAANRQEMDCALAQARQHPHVTSLVLGNEAILTGALTSAQLCQALDEVREQVDIPVTTGEPWHVWVEHPELAAHVDYLLVHIHPFWERQPVEAALAFIQAKYELLREQYPGRRIVLGEIGWPTAGDAPHPGVIPSEDNQVRLAEAFLQWAREEGVECIWFEAFDEPWKCEHGRAAVECHWGIYNADRSAKPARDLFVLSRRAVWLPLALR